MILSKLPAAAVALLARPRLGYFHGGGSSLEASCGTNDLLLIRRLALQTAAEGQREKGALMERAEASLVPESSLSLISIFLHKAERQKKRSGWGGGGELSTFWGWNQIVQHSALDLYNKSVSKSTTVPSEELRRNCGLGDLGTRSPSVESLLEEHTDSSTASAHSRRSHSLQLKSRLGAAAHTCRSNISNIFFFFATMFSFKCTRTLHRPHVCSR